MEATILGENKKAYKGFNVDGDNRLYCEPGYNRMYYAVGEVAEVKGSLELCRNGIHFCWNLNDVHDFYNLKDKVICEVEILGDVVNESDMKKSCTNKLRLVKLLTREEVFAISNTGTENTGVINSGNRNTGDWNTGDWNTGNRNTGDWNTGDWNTGDWNTGNRNTGNRNTGNRNTGDWNTGNRNTGNRNTGDWNTGDWNTGDWNTGNRNTGIMNQCDYSNGVLCTVSPKIALFNVLTDMTFEQFQRTRWYDALFSTTFTLTEWIWYTDEEKANDKAKELIGGYLKRYGLHEAYTTWWNDMSGTNREIIMSMPNFDKAIFKEVTGIDVDA